MRGRTDPEKANQVLAPASFANSRHRDRFYPLIIHLDDNISPAANLQSSGDDPCSELQPFGRNVGPQMYGAALLGSKDRRRQNGSRSSCPPRKVAQSSVDISLNYQPTFLEFWPQDGKNLEPGDNFVKATLALGQTLRQVPR